MTPMSPLTAFLLWSALIVGVVFVATMLVLAVRESKKEYDRQNESGGDE